MARKYSIPELIALEKKYAEMRAELEGKIAKQVGSWVLKKYPSIESLKDFKERFDVIEKSENVDERSEAAPSDSFQSTDGSVETSSDELAHNERSLPY